MAAPPDAEASTAAASFDGYHQTRGERKPDRNPLYTLAIGVAGASLVASVVLLVNYVWAQPSENEAAASLMRPLDTLKWDAGFESKERFDGWLTVPLVPDAPNVDEVPKLRIRIRMRPAKTQPAPGGPMLVHCGGPGSGKTCVNFLAPLRSSGKAEEELTEMYDIFAIDQRGINESEPVLHCGVHNATLPTRSSTVSLKDFFPDCPCAGIPNPSYKFSSSSSGGEEARDNHELDYFKQYRDVNYRCNDAPHLKRGANNEFKVTDYMGTSFLAHDLDFFRRAIGARKLSILGISYGTWVGGVYASIYPENTDKLIIIGNLPPMPTVPRFSSDYAISQQGVKAEFVDRCRLLVNCSERDPAEAFRELTESLDNGEWKAQTDFGEITLSPYAVTAQMHGVLRDQSHGGQNDTHRRSLLIYTKFADTLNEMLDLPTENRTAFVESQLNKACSVVVPIEEKEKCVDAEGNDLAIAVDNHTIKCPTWKQYGLCAANYTSPRIQGNLVYTTVMAGDVPSRLLPSQMVDLNRRLRFQYGLVGDRASYILAQTALWPGKSTYPGIGNALLRPLILGNLDDSATGYKWTQEMKLAFPNAHLMTFNGFFHGFPSPFTKRERGKKGLYDCWLALQEYVRSGTLPRNGRTCLVNRFGIDDQTPVVPNVALEDEWDFLRVGDDMEEQAQAVEETLAAIELEL